MSSRTERQPAPRPRIRESAKALLTRGDRTLIVKERHGDGTPFWTLPGGGIEANESRPAALRRELAEELQCQSAVGERVSRFWYAHTSRDMTISLCSVYDCVLVTAASPNLTEGVIAKRWAAPDELPSNTLPQVRYLIERRS
ncbi:NUDIX domain-containing protein [Halovenus sp. WSH3]|uniref:NUDIX domain-containing protein n=1 Tax=Halovenus carboxidivorans TaxID=2692199 RepID=A0A6B0T9Q6_9EURY|nr:NUDIX domain-containing protein [Halovenus carboxidivorans]MXR52976.1 NUDIX domain-containing protein [Halovenus carboxidivorans]